jgi:hypothetical protein
MADLITQLQPHRVWPTGPGKYSKVKDTPDEYTVCLYNFDINGATLKPGHTGILSGRVYQMLYDGGSASILGTTSTTGDDAWDLALSRQRADEVARFLRGQWGLRGTAPFFSDSQRGIVAGGGPISIRHVAGLGKTVPLALRRPNNAEMEGWRAVWIKTWSRSVPPSDKELLFDLNLPDLPSSWSDTAGQALDATSWFISVALGDFIPLVDLAVTLVDTLASLPLAWMSADNGARIYGFILGYNNAMQDMANQYDNDAVRGKKPADWPAVVRPQVHSAAWASQTWGSQDAWHEGEQSGCKAAWDAIQKLERTPWYKDVTSGGVTRQVPISGKLFLRNLYRAYGDNVAAHFMLKANEALKAKGMKAWPGV